MATSNHVSNDLHRVEQHIRSLILRHRLTERLAQFCDLDQLFLRVRNDTETIWQSGDEHVAANSRRRTTCVAPIRFQGDVVAQAVAAGRPRLCRRAAHLFAGWMEDLLNLEQEINSLTQEVVHSYEELHVLYDLGTSLGGVLELDAVSQLIGQALLSSLQGGSVTVTLLWDGAERIAAHLSRPVSQQQEVRSDALATASLCLRGTVIGTLTVAGKVGRNDFTSGDLKLLHGIAALAGPALHHAKLYEIVRRQADTDALTGVLNHRLIQDRLREELERSQRYEHPLSIAIIEIDQLKLFYDLYGHAAANNLLVLTADLIRSVIRAIDIVGASGEDKFIVVLPETNAAGAWSLGERLAATSKACEVVVEGTRLALSLSIGLASYPEHAITKHSLITTAEEALAEAKASGGGALRCARETAANPLAWDGSTFSVLQGLVRAVDVKDHYTQEHSEVVTDAALLLGQQLKLSEETLHALRIAGLLHDVGKIGIPDHILKKPGKLTNEEYEIMKHHVVLSEMIIKGVPHLDDVLDAVAHHHERFDGRGYPHGKQADAIPLLGRIMAIADAYSAMCMDRPYRKGLSWEQARAELERGSGSQFDPRLVPLFIQAMETKGTENHSVVLKGSDLVV